MPERQSSTPITSSLLLAERSFMTAGFPRCCVVCMTFCCYIDDASQFQKESPRCSYQKCHLETGVGCWEWEVSFSGGLPENIPGSRVSRCAQQWTSWRLPPTVDWRFLSGLNTVPPKKTKPHTVNKTQPLLSTDLVTTTNLIDQSFYRSLSRVTSFSVFDAPGTQSKEKDTQMECSALSFSVYFVHVVMNRFACVMHDPSTLSWCSFFAPQTLFRVRPELTQASATQFGISLTFLNLPLILQNSKKTV